MPACRQTVPWIRADAEPVQPKMNMGWGSLACCDSGRGDARAAGLPPAPEHYWDTVAAPLGPRDSSRPMTRLTSTKGTLKGKN